MYVSGEEYPFVKREVTIHSDRWVTDDYNISDVLLGR